MEFSALIKIKNKPDRCITKDFDSVNQLCNRTQIFHFLFIPADTKFVIRNSDGKCLYKEGNMEDCDFKNKDSYMTVGSFSSTNDSRIINVEGKSFKLTKTKFSFKSGINILIIEKLV